MLNCEPNSTSKENKQTLIRQGHIGTLLKVRCPWEGCLKQTFPFLKKTLQIETVCVFDGTVIQELNSQMTRQAETAQIELWSVDGPHNA